ncbi:hypothetical protein ACMA5I_14890 [Paracoccaceae bacterium GXU_MW_L88]
MRYAFLPLFFLAACGASSTTTSTPTSNAGAIGQGDITAQNPLMSRGIHMQFQIGSEVLVTYDPEVTTEARATADTQSICAAQGKSAVSAGDGKGIGQRNQEATAELRLRQFTVNCV